MAGWMVGVSAEGASGEEGTVRHWFLVNEPDQKRAEALAGHFASDRYTLADPTDGYEAIAAVAPLSTETIDAMGVAPSSVVFTGTIYEPRFIST